VDSRSEPGGEVKRAALLSVALLAGIAPGLAAQQVRRLGAPDLEYAEPFTSLVALRELSDGRVVVTDPQDKVLAIVNLATGAVTPIGREGAGPGEWRSPSRLLPLPGDSTLVQDPPNGRLMIVAPDGTPVRTFTPSGGRGTLRFTDGRGRLYYQEPSFRTGFGGAVMPEDSSAVVRYDMATQVHDTVAFAQVVKTKPPVRTPGRPVLIGVVPFGAADDWAVLPDGRLVLVRVADYHVEIVSPDESRVRGPSVRYDALRVTEADKTEWRDRTSATLRRATVIGGPGGPPPALPEPEWPETKPPFLGGGSVFVAPNGEIWVLRTQPHGAPAPVADVFDHRGERIATVDFPARTRLVGFGARSVYLVRVDDDDLQYLQRYRLPPG
jgi:hypothetical protein